ncbi:MAG: hypothetical protein Q6365_021300, partial [Candidatus Sigynarchaeota archaeon]
KPSEKLKPGEIEQAEIKVKAAQEKAAKDQEILASVTADFAKMKVATLKEVIQTLVILEGEFYQIASSTLSGTKDIIAAINVQKELEAAAK